LPRNYLFGSVDEAVGRAFDRAVGRLRDAGAEIVECTIPEFDRITELNARGGIVAAESFAWHRGLIAECANDYDPRVLVRIRRGAELTASDLIDLHACRRELIEVAHERLQGFDGFVCPTVPVVAPPLDALDHDDEYTRVNLLMLRNPTVVNVLDGCALSIPMHEGGEPPTGLMVASVAGDDDRLLRVGAWIEEAL
jgi:aspartyl-tRNA(Asn)/glutamyl-tRNA(Gln) amidotransferase subunit A